jgi:hypothetical protein
MGATCSSETSLDFQRTIQLCIPEERIIYSDSYENLKRYIHTGQYAFIGVT